MHNETWAIGFAFLVMVGYAIAFYAFCCGFMFMLGMAFQFFKFIAGVLA
jgi:hypothetical protein